MLHKKYLTAVFMASMFLPMLGASKTDRLRVEELDLTSVEFVDPEEETIELGFDTAQYLPEGFDPHSEVVNIHSINFLEVEDLRLGFDAQDYLPKGFDAYK